MTAASSSVRGTTARHTAAAALSLADAGGLPYVAVTLRGTRDTLQVTSRGDGLADLGEVPAGHWVVELRTDSLPDGQRAEAPRVALDVAAGDSRTITFRLLPRGREVRLISPGSGDEIPSVRSTGCTGAGR